MLTTPTIRECPNDGDGVYAFHIVAEVTADDLKAMADYMNDAFDRHDKVSMLMIFDTGESAEAGATLDWSVMRSQLRSLSKVEKYAVVDAPERAARMIETLGAVLPLEARAFETEDEAWAFVGACAEDRKMRG